MPAPVAVDEWFGDRRGGDAMPVAIFTGALHIQDAEAPVQFSM